MRERLMPRPQLLERIAASRPRFVAINRHIDRLRDVRHQKCPGLRRLAIEGTTSKPMRFAPAMGET